MKAAPSILTTRQLAVELPRRAVCRGLDLELQPGETLVILGRNGAGKSTLLHTLAGLRPQARGELLLSGKAYRDWPWGNEACLRGLLAQSQPDFFSASVLETALVGRHPYLKRWAWEGEDDEAIARAALAQVGMAEFAERQIQNLSGGERQRVAIAALLVQQPRLYLLDEPIAHLDLHHQVAVLDHFQTLAQQGAGVVMVLHDLNLAARYASHVLLLDGEGGHAFGPACQILEAERLSRAFGHPLRAVPDGEHLLFVPV